MSTKAEIVNYLKSEYGMEENESGSLVANFALENGRSQVVLVAFPGESGSEDILFMSPFAKIGQVAAEKVLSTSTLPVMSTEDFYVSARIFPVANLQPEEVDYMLTMVTLHADNMEQELGLGDDL